MPDARPLIGWGHSRFRGSGAWALRVRWPWSWLAAHGAAGPILELDERARERAPDARVAEPTPVLAFGLWVLDPAAVRRLRLAGYRMVGSIDDDYWHSPPWHDHFNPQGAAREEVLGRIEAVIEEFDVVTVTTTPLAALVTPFARAVRIVPNALDVARIPLARANTGAKRRIGWAGTSTHGGDWDTIRGPIERVLERPEVRLVLLTREPPRWLAAHPRVELHPPVDFSRYYEKLSTLHLDLAIAPLVEHVFNESKSHLKMLDYASLGLAAVASKVGPYRDLPDGQTCLLVPDNDPEAWLSAR